MAVVAAVCLLSCMQGCSYAKPACAVVDVAHAACEYVTVEYLDADGVVQRERVPVVVLREAAIHESMMRKAGAR
jgi:hypothetical protein